MQCRRKLQCCTAPSASGTWTNCVQNWLRLRRLCAASALASKLHSDALVRIEPNRIESDRVWNTHTKQEMQRVSAARGSPLLSSRLLTLTTQVSPHRSQSHPARLLSHHIALHRPLPTADTCVLTRDLKRRDWEGTADLSQCHRMQQRGRHLFVLYCNDSQTVFGRCHLMWHSKGGKVST